MGAYKDQSVSSIIILAISGGNLHTASLGTFLLLTPWPFLIKLSLFIGQIKLIQKAINCFSIYSFDLCINRY